MRRAAGARASERASERARKKPKVAPATPPPPLKRRRRRRRHMSIDISLKKLFAVFSLPSPRPSASVRLILLPSLLLHLSNGKMGKGSIAYRQERILHFASFMLTGIALVMEFGVQQYKSSTGVLCFFAIQLHGHNGYFRAFLGHVSHSHVQSHQISINTVRQINSN